eukprot:scaffold492_cov341-Pavlova_lutheri.AAC.10
MDPDGSVHARSRSRSFVAHQAIVSLDSTIAPFTTTACNACESFQQRAGPSAVARAIPWAS